MIQFVNSLNVQGFRTVAVDIDRIRKTGLVTPKSRWCIWMAATREGQVKPAKIPCDARGKALSVVKPDRWLGFDEAEKAYASGKFDGVGLNMRSTENLVGLDLDNCIDADGGVIPNKESEVTDFLTLGGYVEVSPSARGLRQFLQGNPPQGFAENNGEGLEIYGSASSRYLTLTGQPWPIGTEARPIRANQQGLNDFLSRWGKPLEDAPPPAPDVETFDGVKRTAAEVLKLLKTYNKKGKVTRLLKGDQSDYPGRSEADAALCFEIAYFCRDPKIIDSIVRGSGLMREKWDERRGRQTYGAVTIQNALKTQPRNFDTDQAAKLAKDEAANADSARVRAKGANLIGGCDDLLDAKTGRLKADIFATTEVLIRDRRLLGVAYWDEFAGAPMITRSFREAFQDNSAPATVGRLTDDHLLSISVYLAREWGVTLRPQENFLIAKRWAQSVRRNPVKERLEELERGWDGKERLQDVLVKYARAKTLSDDGRDIGQYVRAVTVRWFLSVVARCMQPGCKVDTLLILEGKQGARKSTFARIVASSLGECYFRDGFSLGNGKDDRIALQNRAIVEWSELGGLGRREVSELKNFISQQTDSYRTPYGTVESDHPRTSVFIATTNQGEYLADPTGGRRFWPVKVGGIDIDGLKRDIDWIWGEAVSLWRSGARWWFDDHNPEDQRILYMAESEQSRRMVRGIWDDVAASLSERLVVGDLPLLDSSAPAWHAHHFSVEQMRHWVGGNSEGASKIDETAWIKIAKSLRSAGWESVAINGRSRWRLTQEARHRISEGLGVDPDPKKSIGMIAAEAAAARALEAARVGGKKAQTQE